MMGTILQEDNLTDTGILENKSDASNVFISYHQTALAFHN